MENNSEVIIERILDYLEQDEDIELVSNTGDCEESYIVKLNDDDAEYRIIVRKEM